MKRKFVICIDDSTKVQQDKLTEFFKGQATIGYWHWFSDMWLITDPNSKWTVGQLREEIDSLLPGAHKMVIQIDGDNTWSGFGNAKMFEWLQDSWSD